MVSMTALWLPIVLSAVFVFVASSVIHMAINYHKNDMQRLPGEEKIAAAIRAEKVTAGDYVYPRCESMSDMNSPAMQEKMKQGPMFYLTVMPPGPVNMGKALGSWFVFTLVVGFITAYVTSRTLAPGTHYLQVFRVAGTVAFLTYAGSEPVQSIWKSRAWGVTAKHLLDGLIYGLLTAGAFGWLWPR